jgi:hypothetical protein
MMTPLRRRPLPAPPPPALGELSDRELEVLAMRSASVQRR